MVVVVGIEDVAVAIPLEGRVHIMDGVVFPEVVAAGAPTLDGAEVVAVAADAVDLVADDAVVAAVQELPVVVPGDLLAEGLAARRR